MDEYRIVNYIHGKFGYKTFFELQKWNSVYEKYSVIKESLELIFIKDYCLYLSDVKIDFENTKIIYKE